MDIIDEIAEEMQYEKLLNFWRRYSVGIYVFIGCVIIGTALYAFWKEYQNQEIQKASTLYGQALQEESLRNLHEAQKLLHATIDSKSPGYKALAELSLSDLLSNMSDHREEADTLLMTLTRSSTTPESLRLLGTMKLMLHHAESHNISSLREELKTTSHHHHKSWVFLAQELMAAVEFHEGHFDKAYGLYDALFKNPLVSPGIRQRALRMIMILDSKGIHFSEPSKFGKEEERG